MPDLDGDTVALRPLRFDDAERLREIHLEPAVTAWWGSMEESFPFDEPDATRFTIVVDGEIAGLIQYGEEPEPMYRHAWIDLFVTSSLQGRGIGTEAVLQVVKLLRDQRGHHRVTIDPSVENVAAVRAYEKAGFSRVGVMRMAERAPDGQWRDALLMEQVFPDVAGLTSDEEPS